MTGLLDDVTARLGESRQNLAELNDSLIALQELVARLRDTIPLVFTILSVVGAVLLGWVIYSQVAVIRLFARRWKGLGGASD